MSEAAFQYVLRLGDNALINGQRLSEWCGHSPFLEEDIAMANTALDHIGRARMLLSHAGQLEGAGRNEDDLAYLRNEQAFGNFLICELPIGDYAFTLLRQYLLDVYHRHLYTQLCSSSDQDLAGIAAKAVKEARYHVRRSGEWILRFGQGTDESHQRLQRALDELWAYTPELFAYDEVDRQAEAAGVAPELSQLETAWRDEVEPHLGAAELNLPEQHWFASGGREGLHSEHMGRLLAEMQILQRTYPGLEW